MTICGMTATEKIIVHPDDAPHTSHWVAITTDKDEPKFYVTSCCGDEWIWEFWYSKTNYEAVKYLITASVMECETMEELIDMLDEVFEEECYDMVYDVDEYCCGECECDCEEEIDSWECDGDCANCEFYEE